MRRRAALNRQAAGVSLFPFLAVLLCTMGALIVVLVVIARQAHLQVAAAAHQAETAAADGELALKQSDLEWRISELRSSRDKTRQQLADKQLELAHLEEHARRLRDQLDELAKARAGLSEAAGGDAREGARLRADLERLQHNATALRLEVSKLTKNGDAPETYAILPYSGPNETRRRPIYIECRAGAIVLQPDGVVLTARDFIIDAGPSNPLASALRAARDYYVNNGIRGRGEQGNPYPLLIIRPDGIQEQELARLAIMSWGGDFGYELVAQDWPLEYPPPDPLLSLAMRQAVSEGRTRQAYIASAAPTLMRGGHSSGRYRVAQHGGVVQVDGSPVGGDLPRGGMSGRRYRRPSGMGGNSGSGTGLAGYRPGGGGGGSLSAAGGDDNPYLDAIKEDQRAAGTGGGGRGAGRGGTGIGSQGSGGTGGSDRLGGAGQVAAGGSGPWAAGQGGTGGGKGDVGPRYGGGGGVGTGNGDVGPRYAGGGMASAGTGKGDVGPRYAGGGGPADAANGSSPGSGGNATGGAGQFTAAGQPGTNGFGGGQAPGSASSGGGLANGSAAGASRGSPGGTAAGNGRNRAGGANNQLAGQRTGKNTGGAGSADGTPGAAGANDGSPAGSDGNAYRSGSSTGSYNRLAGGGARGGTGGRAAVGGLASNGSSSSQGSSSNSSAAGSSSANGGASGTAGQPGAQSAQGGPSMPMINLGQSGMAGQQSVAAQRGQKNWANPDAATTSMPIERQIRMVCDSEHLTLLPETGGLRGMKVIRLGPRTETSVDDLVSAVWDRIDSWGSVGNGMYWRPKLQMIVEPGGQRRYTELQALLADSGFDVHGKPRTRETAMAPPAEPPSAPAGDRSWPKARIRRLRSPR